MSGNKIVAVATRVMVVHKVCVAPDHIGAGPQNQDEEAE